MDGEEIVKWGVGGALAGICIMAAAPVLGPVGALTAAGAAIGGVGGGLAGGILGAIRRSPNGQKAKAEAQADEATAKAAEYAIKISKLKDLLKKQGEQIKGWAEFEKFIVIFTAIGFSIAEQNGELRDELRQTIEEFVVGLSKNMLPAEVRATINKYAKSPPAFNTAKGLYAMYDAAFSDRQWLDIVNSLIDVLDSHPSTESEPIAAWNAAWNEELRRARAAARQVAGPESQSPGSAEQNARRA
jgi:hypothetical protein